MSIQNSFTTLVKSIFSIAILTCIGLLTQAAVYTTQKSGAFDKQEIWTPFYPGNIIRETDTVVINHAVAQNIDVVVKGTMIIKEKASLTGDRNMIIVKSGT